jgi:hypothetical protein
VAKFDASGNLIWAKQFGGPGFEYSRSVAVDGSGNVYLLAQFDATADVDPGAATFSLTPIEFQDSFIAKLDASGNFVWARQIGGFGYQYGISLALDASGNVYTTGSFENTVDFDPGVGSANLTAAGGRDAFIYKLDAAGNFGWVHHISGGGIESGSSIAISALGEVLVSGSFTGIVDFDPGASAFSITGTGGSDIFVCKLNASGSFMWAVQLGGTGTDAGASIAVDASGNVYSAGYFDSSGDFDPGLGTATLTAVGAWDIYVSKLDASGNYLWAKSFGGLNNDSAGDLDIDASGNVYSTGVFDGTVDFDPGAGTFNLSSAGSIDVFVSKMDASGNFLWARAMGGISYEEGTSIAVDASENVYTTGAFDGSGDYNPGVGMLNITSSGSIDAFIHKMHPCTGNTSSVSVTACMNYTSPSGNAIWTTSGTYVDTIDNASGCDSIITINLTINTVDVGATTTGVTIMANATGATYQWLDCNSSFVAISGEINQSFTATANGNYAVAITESGCTDTSSCIAITGVGLFENSFGETINVFPNPTTGQVTLELGSSQSPVMITVRNAMGQTVQQTFLNGNNNTAFVLEGEPGIYFVEVKSGDNRGQLIVVKE